MERTLAARSQLTPSARTVLTAVPYLKVSSAWSALLESLETSYLSAAHPPPGAGGAYQVAARSRDCLVFSPAVVS